MTTDQEQFAALAGVSSEVANQYLEEHDSLESALDAFFAESSRSEPKESNIGSMGRKNGPSGGSGDSQAASRPRNNNFMSFSQMVNDTNDDDDSRNTFAGGETSGLEITDPADSSSLIKDLLEKAKRGGEQAGTIPEPNEENTHFEGRGYRLGSSIDAQPQVVDQPSAPKPKRVTREITFWREGFQVGDGPLYRYDDPANSFYLNELNHGRAPLKLLEVEFGQEVDVNVHKRLDESYKPPKGEVRGFLGSGQRLGSPIPGDTIERNSHESSNPEKVETESQPSQATKPEGPSSDPNKIAIQLRYANGTREVLRLSPTQTVNDLYAHVEARSDRSFTLNHAFPVETIDRSDQSLADSKLSNATVVQRWA